MIEVVVASKNAAKIREIRRIMAGLPMKFLAPGDIEEWPDIEETGRTYVENALIKAVAVSKVTGRPALADDSGLEVDALDGLPGVRSARFAGPNATEEQNNLRLASLLHGVPPERRRARYRCAAVLWAPEGLRTAASEAGTPAGSMIQQAGKSGSGSQAPPGRALPEAGPPGLVPPRAVPPEAVPPGALPPKAVSQGSLPPEALPPEAGPPGLVPAGAVPPEAVPPEAVPPEALRPEAVSPAAAPLQVVQPGAGPEAVPLGAAPLSTLAVSLVEIGVCEGSIATEPKGAGGFGYDPWFIPEGDSRRMAELTDEEKDLISHRGKAVRGLRSQIERLLIGGP